MLKTLISSPKALTEPPAFISLLSFLSSDFPRLHAPVLVHSRWTAFRQKVFDGPRPGLSRQSVAHLHTKCCCKEGLINSRGDRAAVGRQDRRRERKKNKKRNGAAEGTREPFFFSPKRFSVLSFSVLLLPSPSFLKFQR